MSETANFTIHDDLTPEQFEVIRASGSTNPSATFADYLALKREREEMRLEANRMGWTAEAPPEFTAKDEEILAQLWAELGEQKKAAANESRSSARAA